MTPDQIYNLSDSEKLNLLMSFLFKVNYIKILLSDFVKEYLIFVKNKHSFSYWRNSGITFRHLQNFFKCDVYLDEITVKDAENFILQLKNEGAPKAYQDYFRNVRAGFSKAKNWNYISDNPFDKIKIPKVQKNESSLITDSVLSVILQNTTNKQMQDIFIFAISTGARVGEIVNLCLSDVNFNDRVITIGNIDFSTKSRKQRIIPLSDIAFDIIASRLPKIIKPGKNFIFCNSNGGQFTTDYLSKAFKRAIKNSGLDANLHFHDLRKGFCSKLVSKGVNTFVIQQLMGHSSISTTQIYAKVNPDMLRDAINTLNNNPDNMRKAI